MHHLTLSGNGQVLASAGFDGVAKIWLFREGVWEYACEVVPSPPPAKTDGASAGGKGRKKSVAGELWAVALDVEGRYLAATTYDGRVNVWEVGSVVDEKTGTQEAKARWFTGWETKGSFGLAVDLVSLLVFVFAFASAADLGSCRARIIALRQRGMLRGISTFLARLRHVYYTACRPKARLCGRSAFHLVRHC